MAPCTMPACGCAKALHKRLSCAAVADGGNSATFSSIMLRLYVMSLAAFVLELHV